MAVKPAYTKRGDTETLFTLNMDLTAATMKAFAKNKTTNDVTQLSVSAVSGFANRVAVQTSVLPVGSYNLEVEVTSGGKIATFPDQGYLSLIVVEDLG